MSPQRKQQGSGRGVTHPTDSEVIRAERGWTFLSNHGHVLIYLSRDPEARMRDIAQAIGITERSTQAILNDLEQAGYLLKAKVGRRNQYTIQLDQHFRHPTESHKSIRLLIDIFG
jgi:DNA-binding MarR family transcriptional regulator